MLKNVLVVLALLIVVGGAVGGWNYHRNWSSEQEDSQPRPFMGYSDADLEALASAYQAEIDAYQAKTDTHTARRVDVKTAKGSIAENIDEFERIHRQSSKIRDMVTLVAEREARIREIREEQRMRGGRATGLALHVERLTRF